MLDVAFQALRSLNAIITNSLDSIEATLRKNGQQFPSPSQSFTMKSEAPRHAQEILLACDVLSAVATRLIVAVQPPMVTALVAALQVTSFGNLLAAFTH